MVSGATLDKTPTNISRDCPCILVTLSAACQEQGQVAQRGLVALETCDGRSRADAHGALGGLPGKEEVISFPSHRETGHSGGGSQSTHGPRPCRSPGSSSLPLRHSVQGPMRKPQNAEFQEAAREVKGLGAAGHCPPCLMQSLIQAQDPSSLSKARLRIPQLSHTHRSPLHLILGDCGSLLQAMGSMKKGCWRSSTGPAAETLEVRWEASQACHC